MASEDEVLRETAVHLRAMIEGKGWKNVVKPNLLAMRSSLLQKLCSPEKTQEHKDFLRLQAQVWAVSWILTSVEVTMAQAKAKVEQKEEEGVVGGLA